MSTIGMASEKDESGNNDKNGSSVINRPGIEDIDSVIKKYVKNVRKIKVKE